MAENLVLLETIELTQTASSVTFDNIPQTGYTDLKIVYSAQGTVGDQPLYFYFNGSNTNLSMRELYANGSSAASQALSNGFLGGITGATTGVGGTNIFANGEVYIPNYTGTNAKSIFSEWVQEANAATAYTGLHAGLWNPGTQAAITSITIYPGGNNLSVGSTFSLYGVAALGTTPTVAPKATGGNIVASDGTYWYHAFLTSGIFTPQTPLSDVDYLVVAGGGSGTGGNGMGGGGAGGLRSTVTATGGGGSLESKLSLSVQNYPVIIGAGGASVTGEAAGNNGSNSVFSTITAIGGGAGGYYGAGVTGGSGGGGSRGGSGGSGTANQGYAGGGSANSGNYGTGGGGGAGAVGGTGTTSVNGNGGNGVTITALATPTSTGVSGAYAGGGGGGVTYDAGWKGNNTTGGTGGGGDSNQSTSNAGAMNTGSGGAGAGGSGGFNHPSGAGASGIVIIRYAIA